MNDKHIFTILYELGKQLFLVGVTNDCPPKLAAQGVNTTRPLPQDVKDAIIEAVMEIRQLKEKPLFVDYNAPSTRISYSLLGNFDINPLIQQGAPKKTIAEAVQELKEKLKSQ